MHNELRATTDYAALEKYAYLQDVYICTKVWTIFIKADDEKQKIRYPFIKTKFL